MGGGEVRKRAPAAAGKNTGISRLTVSSDLFWHAPDDPLRSGKIRGIAGERAIRVDELPPNLEFEMPEAFDRLDLSQEEIIQLTGYRWPTKQIEMLESMGVPARRRLDNSVFVLRAHCMRPMAPQPQTEQAKPKLRLIKRKR